MVNTLETSGVENLNGPDVVRRVNVLAACAALNSVSLGIAVGMVSTVSPLLQREFGLSSLQLGLWQGSISFWAIFGAIGASLTLDPFGRRSVFVVASCMFVVGAVVQATATAYVTVMVGIAIVGISCGYSLAIDPIYIAEISPAAVRGFYVTASEIAICVGQFSGFVIGWGLDVVVSRPSLRWRLMCACCCISPLGLLLAVALVLPESPRWLAVNGREREAVDVLSRYIGMSRPAAESLVDQVCHDHSLEEIEKKLDPSCGPWYALACSANPAVQYMVLVGVGTAISQQIVAVDAVLYEFLFAADAIGITSTVAQYGLLAGLGFLKLCAALVSARFLDKVGRYPLIVGSAAACFATLVLVAAYFAILTPQTGPGARAWLFVLLSYVYIVAFELGLGPGCWLIPSEVFYNKIRLPAMGMATLSNRATTTLMVTTAFSIRKLVGYSGLYVWFAFCALLGFIFLFLYLPETSGKSLEEMYDYFVGITAARRASGTPLAAPLAETPSAAIL
ncbi:hypothetical protein CTAYLR_008376 [Chrysophaeum taylorii]|uniref:Hexose transporter 1 n=1 Tax=Chrysophaeum taylorii TaxID=2483200 RepID=A0AAD7XNU5_9STRA|nr:hypothetical protein CTAYLR_008376 [Chrysophaeum taylorii]